MKRSSSDIESSPTLPPPPQQPSMSTSSEGCTEASPSKIRKPKGSPTGRKGVNGDFTPDKRAAVIERLIILGTKATSVNTLAEEFGVNPLQMKNALHAGRAGNLRDKVIKGVKGDRASPKS